MLDSLLRAVLPFISCVLALKIFVVAELLKITWLSSVSCSSAELLMLSQMTAAGFSCGCLLQVQLSEHHQEESRALGKCVLAEKF